MHEKAQRYTQENYFYFCREPLYNLSPVTKSQTLFPGIHGGAVTAT